jgi:PAS domain S-box-containing protein
MALHDKSAAAVDLRTQGPMRAVFDASPVPTVITGRADGRILLVNTAALTLLGWEQDAVIGRTMDELGFWTQPEQRTAMLARLDSPEGMRDVDLPIRTASGESIVALTSISPVELDGEACLVGHIYDVTAARRLEAQLRESEERFRQVTETLHQGFLLRDLDAPLPLYVSSAVERIFGLDRATLYSDPDAMVKLIHPQDRESVTARRDAMTGATDFEFRIVRPDGRVRWIRSRAEPVRMRQGHMTRVASVFEDVTEERELREALRASEERFRLLAENSTDVIARSAPDWTIEYMSPACRAVYGYEPEEMVGRGGWEFVHPDDRARLAAEFDGRLARAGVVTSVYRVLRRDGSFVWVETKTRAVCAPGSDDVIELHTSARDISDRKKAEAVVARTTEAAERANHAKSEFLSRMSHELRTPLHSILGFSELLAHEDLEQRLRDGLGLITRSGRHLLELINEVLDISAIERGELRLSLEPVHVQPLVGEVLDMLGPLADAGSISLRVPDEAALDCHVLADHQRLKQVLLNLLSNAVKYNRPGGDVEVTCTCEQAVAQIAVADSGIGIAPENHRRLFAAFERLGAQTSDVEGTGLGLTLTKRLVEAMNGAITVDSEVGVGTTFVVELPLVDAPLVQSAQAGAGAVGAEPRRRRPARTILYIEDNPSNIRLAEAILHKRPEVTLLIATQGGLGLDLAREHRPAVVLLDLNLPDISGEEVLRRLRGDPRTAETAVVILSADATPRQIARLRRAGADDYLTKPFEIERFLAVIDGAAAPEAPADAGDLAAGGAEPAGPLHPDRLLKLRRLYPDEGALREFVELFLHDVAARIEVLHDAARAGDATGVWQAAHAMRGSCSLAGAHRVEALLAGFEAAARRDEVPDDERIGGLRAAHRDAARALELELELTG